MNKQTSNYKIDFLDLIEISVATVNLHKRVDEKTGKKLYQLSQIISLNLYIRMEEDLLKLIRL